MLALEESPHEMTAPIRHRILGDKAGRPSPAKAPSRPSSSAAFDAPGVGPQPKNRLPHAPGRAGNRGCGGFCAHVIGLSGCSSPPQAPKARHELMLVHKPACPDLRDWCDDRSSAAAASPAWAAGPATGRPILDDPEDRMARMSSVPTVQATTSRHPNDGHERPTGAPLAAPIIPRCWSFRQGSKSGREGTHSLHQLRSPMNEKPSLPHDETGNLPRSLNCRHEKCGRPSPAIRWRHQWPARAEAIDDQPTGSLRMA